MSMSDLRESNRRGGFYWDKRKPYISVTTILQVLDKPALRWWFGQQVYNAMVVDPTLGQKEALNAPYATSKKAMSRGTTVHSIVENYKHSKEYLAKLPEDFKPYAEAFYTWFEDNDVEIVDNEMTVLSKKYGYAGTLDITFKFRKKGRLLIGDIKTGKDIYEEVFLQLSAYKNAYEEMKKQPIDGIAVILLSTGRDGKATGKYKFEEGEYCFDEFLAARKLWIWKNQDLIQSIKKQMAAKKTREPQKKGVQVESNENELAKALNNTEGGE